MFQDAPSNTTCRECPRGYSNKIEGSAGCNAVPPGSYVLEGEQKECETGYKCKGGTKTREECPPGRYAPDVGSVACVACSPGTIASNSASKNCSNCDVGQYTNEMSAIVCNDCLSGFYQRDEGQASCLPCIPVSILSLVSPSVSSV